MKQAGFELHNVAETLEAPGGQLLQRIPEAVRLTLNPGGQEKARHVPGVEVRFAWNWETPARVRLSSEVGALAVPFYGDFQAGPPVAIGKEPVTLELLPSPRFRAFDFSSQAAQAFSPRLARVILMGGPTVLHEVNAEGLRAPEKTELPATRYAAYGSSITHGVYASGPHLTYPARIARAFGWDGINLGFRGTALAEPGMADYLADAVPWDVLTLEASVNMAGRFSPQEFYDRWNYFIRRVAAARPEKPVVILNMFLHFRDLPVDHDEAKLVNAEAHREQIRRIVCELSAPNVTLLENDQLVREPLGLTADLLHPSDDGFEWMARGVVTHLRDRLGFKPALRAFC